MSNCLYRILCHKVFLPLILVFLLTGTNTGRPLALAADEPDLVGEISNLIDKGGYAIEQNGVYLAARNLHVPYIPASTIKIATTLAALEALGPAFRFETLFYRDSRNNLYIKGYGDPFLVSEEVAVIVSKLKGLGCDEINDIYLDDSAFKLARITDGSGLSANPYDARNSGLAVNFNTVNIRVFEDGTVVSAEKQTPTLPLMQKLAGGLGPGIHRINIGRQQKNSGEIPSSRYVGELFRSFQKKENISGIGTASPRKTPPGLKLFYRHRSSKTVKDLIRPLMLYSNNFMANQLFLAVGAAAFGYPANWEKSQRAVTDILREKYHLAAPEIFLAEGSGLSRKNRVTPHAMMQLLEAFKPFAEYLPLQDDLYIKSGTLQGVYAYAGYFRRPERLDGFVVLLNQKANNRDKVLDLLEKLYGRD